MDDNMIVDLYWERSETAIEETSKKYSNYCYHIAFNILQNDEDANECVNDTYLRAWNAMPPKRPNMLAAFPSISSATTLEEVDIAK
jgi:DNA-directed RNA polymerase specialized sigma24 family protein